MNAPAAVHPVERLVIEAECARLVVSFCAHIDGRHYDSVVALFTPDGVFERRSKVHVGHAAIRRELDARAVNMVSRHLCTNVQVTVIDADHAQASSYFLVLRQDGVSGDAPFPLDPPDGMGEFHDRLVRTGEGWRIAHRVTKAIFRSPRATAAQRADGAIKPRPG